MAMKIKMKIWMRSALRSPAAMLSEESKGESSRHDDILSEPSEDEEQGSSQGLRCHPDSRYPSPLQAPRPMLYIEDSEPFSGQEQAQRPLPTKPPVGNRMRRWLSHSVRKKGDDSVYHGGRTFRRLDGVRGFYAEGNFASFVGRGASSQSDEDVTSSFSRGWSHGSASEDSEVDSSWPSPAAYKQQTSRAVSCLPSTPEVGSQAGNGEQASDNEASKLALFQAAEKDAVDEEEDFVERPKPLNLRSSRMAMRIKMRILNGAKKSRFFRGRMLQFPRGITRSLM